MAPTGGRSLSCSCAGASLPLEHEFEAVDLVHLLADPPESQPLGNPEGRLVVRGDGRSHGRDVAKPLDTLDQPCRGLEPESPTPVGGVDPVADLDYAVRVRRPVEANPANHGWLAACDHGAEQPSVVDTLADLTLAELEHVAIFRRPFGRVSNSGVFEERQVSAADHLIDDLPWEGDKCEPRTSHHFV